MAIDKHIKIGWHYTTGEKFIQIIESGYLQPTSIGVSYQEKPILWFSTHEFWEPTACKAIITNGERITLSMDETRELGGGLVRFGVYLNQLQPWDKLKKKARIPIDTAKSLELVAVKQCAKPSQWCSATINLSGRRQLS
jgi:hypothetical protein